MSGTSFQTRALDITFTRTKGQFANGSDRVKLTGLRASATVSHVGGDQLGSLSLQVFGMTQRMMNDLTWQQGLPIMIDGGGGDRVTVEARSGDGAAATVYDGTIYLAAIDFNSVPQVAFHVEGILSYNSALESIPATSYRGSADVTTILANLARQMRLRFENSGVTGIRLSNPYFSGSPMSQAQECRRHAGIEMHIGDGVLAIWPRGGHRGGAVALISPATGLVGYPTRTTYGVLCTTLFNPAITFGAQVKIETTAPQCSGTWTVTQMEHRLESGIPDGSWFTHITTMSAEQAVLG